MGLMTLYIITTSVLLTLVLLGVGYCWNSIRLIRRDLQLPPLRDKINPLDLTPRLIKNAPRIKPKYRSDFDLFEREKEREKNS